MVKYSSYLSLGNRLRRGSAVAIGSLASLLSYTDSKTTTTRADAIATSAIINVDQSWTYQEINSILDGVSGTLNNRNNGVDAQPGDIVSVIQDYQLPIIQEGASIDLRGTGGITFKGNNTKLRGAQRTSGAIIRIYSPNNIIRNFTFENSFFGIVAESNYAPTIIQDVTFGYSLDTAGVWKNPQSSSEQGGSAQVNSVVGLIINRVNVLNIPEGFRFENRGFPITFGSPIANIRNSTLAGIGRLGIQPVTVPSGGSNCPTILGETVGCLFVNSPGVSLRPVELCPTPPSNSFTNTYSNNTSIICQFPSSSNIRLNGEFNVDDLDPDCPGFQTLASYFGNDNFYEDPRLTPYGRPKIPSPAVGPQFPLGYAGANPPYGDWDGDAKLTVEDLIKFEEKFTGSCTGCDNPCAPLEDLVVFDANGDCGIDDTDRVEFMRGYNASVPTVSEWGLGITALLLVSAGAIRLRNKRKEQ